MSLEYPCVYYDDKKCKAFTDSIRTSFCGREPCEYQCPSNADRIRAMSDEELAIWIDERDFCADYCPASTNEVEEAIGYRCPANCKEQVLNWLQQPAKEEENA